MLSQSLRLEFKTVKTIFVNYNTYTYYIHLNTVRL